MRVQTLAAAAAIWLQISSIASAQISLSSVSVLEDVLREGDPAELVVSWRSGTGGVTGTITFESSDPTLFPAPEPVEVSGGPVGTVRRTIEPARLTGLIGARVTLTARTDAPAPGDVRSASLVVRPVHDDCGAFGGAWQIFDGETLEGSLAQATPDGTAGCLVGTDPPDVWHRFVAPGDGMLTLSACGTHDGPGVDQGMDVVFSYGECADMVGCVDNAPCDGDAGLNRDATLVREMRVGEELLVRIAARTNHMADGRYVIAAAFDLEGDDCDEAVPLMLQEAVRFFGTSSAATDGPAAGPCGPIERDVWFEYEAGGNGVVHLDTEGSEFDTVVAVYDALAGGSGAACPPDSGALLACDDDSGADGASRLALPVAPGQSILIQVGGADGASGFGRLNFYFEYVHCPCNIDDNDAHVNVLDLLAYLDRWFAATGEAEFDGEAGVTVFDLLSFLDCWFPASAGERCSE